MKRENASGNRAFCLLFLIGLLGLTPAVGVEFGGGLNGPLKGVPELPVPEYLDERPAEGFERR